MTKFDSISELLRATHGDKMVEPEEGATIPELIKVMEHNIEVREARR